MDPIELALEEHSDLLQVAKQEVDRLTAIIFSIIKRYGEEGSLVLEDIDQDELPEHMVVGWNIIGADAIITLVHGETLEAMKQAWAKNSQSTEEPS